MKQVLSVLILLLFRNEQQQQPINHSQQLTVIVLLVECSCGQPMFQIFVAASFQKPGSQSIDGILDAAPQFLTGSRAA